jgi:AcrR family transcriptional regulator
MTLYTTQRGSGASGRVLTPGENQATIHTVGRFVNRGRQMGRHARGIEDTRAALVAAAWELFGTVGYEAATVEAIITRTGVSKGAFYHHFGSKEELLNAVAEQMTAASWSPVGPLVAESSLGAVEKVSRFLDLLRAWKLANIGAVGEVGRLLYRPENLLLLTKAQARTMELATPALAAIVRQGINEGTFSVRDPEVTSRMVLRLVADATSDMMAFLANRACTTQMVEEIARQIDLVLDAMERLLGAQAGAFRRPGRSALEALCRRIAGGKEGGNDDRDQ